MAHRFDGSIVTARQLPEAATGRTLLSLALALGAWAVAMAVALSVTPSAAASTPACGSAGVTLTAMHSPDGTARPFYGDFRNGSTNRSGYVGYELDGGPLGNDVWIKLTGFTGGKVGLATTQSAAIPARGLSTGGKSLVYAYLTATGVSTSAQTFTVEVWNGKPDAPGSAAVCTESSGFSRVIDVISASANKITSISLSNASPALGGSFQITAVGNTGTMGAGPSTDQSGGKGVFSMAPAMSDSWPADAFTLTGVELTLQGQTTQDRLRVYPASTAASGYTAVYKFTVRARPGGATPVYPVQNIASGTQVKYTGTYPSGTTLIGNPVVTATISKTATALTGSGPHEVTYAVDLRNSSSSAVTLDDLADTPTGAWSFVPGSATLGGTPIADPALDGSSLRFPGPLVVPAAAGVNEGAIVLSYKLSVTGTLTNSVTATVGGETVGAGSGGNQITVDPTAPIITTASLPGGNVGAPYAQPVNATGGTGAYSWSLASGSLPPGLSLDPATGEVAGTPTTVGSSTFTLLVTDEAAKTATKVYTITIVSPTQTLVVTLAGAGQGAVAADSGALDCGSTCSDDYATGSTVTLTATAAAGSVFAGWSGDCAGTSPVCAVTMTQGRSLTAEFVPARSLTVTRSGQGIVESDLGDIACGSTCTDAYDDGTVVTLTAAAASGWTFSGWSGACSGSAETCSVTMTQARSVGAAFTTVSSTPPASGPAPTTPTTTTTTTSTPPPPRSLALTTSVAGGGRVTSTPQGIDCGSTCRAGYSEGTTVTLKATPAVGWLFTGWSGACSGRSSTCVVTLSQARTAGATFGRVPPPAVEPVAVTTALGHPNVESGGTTPVSVRVSNPNPKAQTFTVTVHLPDGVTAVAAKNGRVSGGTITWNVTVPAGGSLTLTGLVAVAGPVRVVAVKTTVKGAPATTPSPKAAPKLRIGGLVAVVYFASDSARLTPTAVTTLERARRGIAANGFRSAVLTCHTDSDGSRAYNYALSQRRCHAVADYLKRYLGIEQVSFKQSAHADTKPAASNATRSGKAANRRVEIRVG